jgi:ketosteroid isomerase-like protein
VEEARRDAGVSDSNVEVIREVNDAIGIGDPRAVAERLDPDVVWEHNIGTGSPEEGVYRGRESLIQLFERIVETWEYIRLEPRTIDRLDDGRYRVRGDLRAKHRTSDAEIPASYEQHLEVRDLLLVKGEIKVES